MKNVLKVIPPASSGDVEESATQAWCCQLLGESLGLSELLFPHLRNGDPASTVIGRIRRQECAVWFYLAYNQHWRTAASLTPGSPPVHWDTPGAWKEDSEQLCQTT